MKRKSNVSMILDFLKATRETSSPKEVVKALKLKLSVVKKALKYLKQKGCVKQGYDEYVDYAGRFVRCNFNTWGGETRTNPVNKTDILRGYDALLTGEEIALTNLTDEEFAVTFTISGLDTDLAKRFAFIVNEETDKKVWKLNRAGSAILKRPILEKKAFSFDRLMPGQTKKYYLEFVVDREYIKKAPKTGLDCTLKINCISLNYHDFFELAIQLYPAWYDDIDG